MTAGAVGSCLTQKSHHTVKPTCQIRVIIFISTPCSSQDYLNPNHMTRREYTFFLVHPFLVLIVRISFQELPQYAAKRAAAFASWSQLKAPGDKTPMNKIPKEMTETVPDQRDSFLALGERCIPNCKV